MTGGRGNRSSGPGGSREEGLPRSGSGCGWTSWTAPGGRLLRRGFLPLFLALIGVVVVAAGAEAQVTPGARVAPADSAAVLLQAAGTFQAEGRSDVARALYEFILRNFPGTPAAEEASGRLADLQRIAEDSDGSGRVELQVWSTVYGLWLGVAVPAALGADGSEAYGAGLLVGGPAGFFAGRALTRNRDITDGQARAYTLGGSWGTWQGLGWANVADASTEGTFAAMVLGGLGGIGIGAALADRPISSAATTAASFGSLWGTWFGVAGGVLLDLEGDALLTAALLGGNAGLAGSALTFPSWRMSRNRQRLISIAGVLGGLGGAGIDLIVQPDNRKVAIAIPLVGSVAGLALGAWFTADRDGGAEGFDSDGGGEGPDGSLLHLDGGSLGFGAPIPTPTLLPGGPSGREWRPGLALTLFRGRF
jgi:hypothetical protein